MASTSFPVAMGDVGGSTRNTLMLGRWDIVVPLERDLDDDPLHDDEVVLKDADGVIVRRVFASDDDVAEDPDSGMLLYTFRDVPFGVYSVAVAVGAQQHPVIAQVIVRAKGVFVGDEQLGADDPLEKLTRAQEPTADPEPPADAEQLPGCG